MNPSKSSNVITPYQKLEKKVTEEKWTFLNNYRLKNYANNWIYLKRSASTIHNKQREIVWIFFGKQTFL